MPPLDPPPPRGKSPSWENPKFTIGKIRSGHFWYPPLFYSPFVRTSVLATAVIWASATAAPYPSSLDTVTRFATTPALDAWGGPHVQTPHAPARGSRWDSWTRPLRIGGRGRGSEGKEKLVYLKSISTSGPL